MLVKMDAFHHLNMLFEMQLCRKILRIECSHCTSYLIQIYSGRFQLIYLVICLVPYQHENDYLTFTGFLLYYSLEHPVKFTRSPTLSHSVTTLHPTFHPCSTMSIYKIKFMKITSLRAYTHFHSLCFVLSDHDSFQQELVHLPLKIYIFLPFGILKSFPQLTRNSLLCSVELLLLGVAFIVRESREKQQKHCFVKYSKLGGYEVYIYQSKAISPT